MDNWFSKIEHELFILKVSSRTLLRDYKKYSSVVIKSYLMWILDIDKKKIRLNQWIRMAYSFGREIDDIIDWDIKLPLWFKDWSEFLNIVKNDLIQTSKPLTKIWFHWRHLIKEFKKLWSDLENDLLDFLDWMRDEYERRIAKVFLDEEQLNELHDKSFRWPQQIYLTGLWSKYHVSQIHELPQILWWIYWLKDLKNDFERWIYNIPNEIVSSLRYEERNLSTIIHSEWFDQRLLNTINKQSINLKLLEEKITSMDFWVKKVCSSLLPEIHDFIDWFDIDSYKKNYL